MKAPRAARTTKATATATASAAPAATTPATTSATMPATPPAAAPAPTPAPDTAPDTDAGDAADTIKEARRWRDQGWSAQVIKNEDDEGWAVSMTPDGQAEPALVGPWTMGRDKKNPKPLDQNAFNTLVKTAHEVVRRHEQHRDATLHQSIDLAGAGDTARVTLDVVEDEFDPHALLSAWDADGTRTAQVKVAPNFRLNGASARRWVDGGFAKPG